MRRIDDENLEEGFGQILLRRVAQKIDHLPGGPERRRRHQRRLHQAAGGILRIFETALERDALDSRHRLEDFALFLPVEILEQHERVVGLEFRHAIGDRPGRQFLENLITNIGIDFGERGEVEVAAHEFDQLRARIAGQILDKGRKIGLVQIARQTPHLVRVFGRNRIGDIGDEFRPDHAVFVIFRREFGEITLRLGVEMGHLLILTRAGAGCEEAMPASCANSALSLSNRPCS